MWNNHAVALYLLVWVLLIYDLKCCVSCRALEILLFQSYNWTAVFERSSLPGAWWSPKYCTSFVTKNRMNKKQKKWGTAVPWCFTYHSEGKKLSWALRWSVVMETWLLGLVSLPCEDLPKDKEMVLGLGIDLFMISPRTDRFPIFCIGR